MSEQQSKGRTAAELFPGLMPTKSPSNQTQPAPKKEPLSRETAKEVVPPLQRTKITPPGPPDISWLTTGQFRAKSKSTNTPTILILAEDENTRSQISETVVDFDYQVEHAESADQAIERTKLQTSAIIILHTGLTSESTEATRFHKHMCEMPMLQRRNILYILIGDKFRTLYNLHALTYSANVVVNNTDVEHLAVIIRKGLQDHRKLFEPFNQAIELQAT
nr:hypothetical protein [Desulfobulbaceae bacterium]